MRTPFGTDAHTATRRNRNEGPYDLRIQGSRGPGSEEHAPLTIPNQSQTLVSTLSRFQRPPVRAEPGTGGRDTHINTLVPEYAKLNFQPVQL